MTDAPVLPPPIRVTIAKVVSAPSGDYTTHASYRWGDSPLPPQARADRVRYIIAEVAAKHDVSVADLLGPRRFRPLVRARWEAAWRLKNLPWSPSFPRVAQWLGYEDHTSCMYAVAEHAKLIAKARALELAATL